MTDTVSDGKAKESKEHYQNMLKILGDFEGTKKKLLEEVASFGTLLSNREDFIRLIFKIGEIADYAQGIGYRLSAVIDRNWKVDKKYTKRLAELNALVLEEMSKIRETVLERRRGNREESRYGLSISRPRSSRRQDSTTNIAPRKRS
jgi:uncharacterized protein Yka (UPF0111/DUF47 family)